MTPDGFDSSNQQFWVRGYLVMRMVETKLASCHNFKCRGGWLGDPSPTIGSVSRRTAQRNRRSTDPLTTGKPGSLKSRCNLPWKWNGGLKLDGWWCWVNLNGIVNCRLRYWKVLLVSWVVNRIASRKSNQDTVCMPVQWWHSAGWWRRVRMFIGSSNKLAWCCVEGNDDDDADEFLISWPRILRYGPLYCY